MRTIALCSLLLCAVLPLSVRADFPRYYSLTDLSASSPGALKFGLYGYDNPALLMYVRQPDLQFTWTDVGGRWNSFNRWGLFMAGRGFGFGMVKTKVGAASIMDYRFSTGFGDRSLSLGIGFGWTGGDKALFHRSNVWTLGLLMRPNPYLSVGLVGSKATSDDGPEAVLDIAGRPLGNELITLFVDYGIQERQTITKGSWSVGAAIEPLPGIRVTGRLFDSKTFRVGMELSVGNASVQTQSSYDRDGKHLFNTYGVRLGARDRTILSRLLKSSTYVEMNMLGRLKYQRFILFDHSNTLLGILAAIDAAKRDESVAGIVINTSGMVAAPQMLWEVRQQIKEFKSSGKRVVVFVERPGIEVYHFASVADKIVLDPAGSITLQGFGRGRTFLKGTLEKLGIGYDEWRLFKYKSAMEALSREKMSEADREQTQKLVDDFYRLARTDICEGRNFTPEKFETLVNDDFIFFPQDAMDKGLVDTLGRWEEAKTMIERLEGGGRRLVGSGSLVDFTLPYDSRWGEPARIAVVYALGECAMDQGIKARSLAKEIESLTNDRSVKAIVVRVDSPGGDAVASDYVAEEMREARKKKPVIVSQGTVAGSGGYWLSMYADTIVTAPTTVTGSIGASGGWLYNKDLKEKLGMSTDVVTSGKHADLGFGFSLPLLGIGLPDRNLTDVERSKVERGMRSLYKEFLQKVAAGRRMSVDSIDSIGQGRVWSGYDAKVVGLADVLGGLERAIALAKDRAHLPIEEEVTIVEIPRPGLFDASGFVPRLLGLDIPLRDDTVMRHLRFLADHNGQPLLVMPMDEIPFDVP